MAEEFYVKGLEQLKRLGEVLREEGSGSVGLDKGVKKRLAAELRKAGAPLSAAIKGAYREEMPKAGGLNEFLASSKVGIRNRFTGASAGMTVVVTKAGHDLEAVESGAIRHPVYGNRGNWVSQEVPADVAGRAFEAMEPEISLRVDAAVEKVIAEIQGAA